MAYGEFETGNLNLCEIPNNLAKEQGSNETEVIRKFWEREYEKCKYVAQRKVQIAKDLDDKQKQEIQRKIKEDALKDHTEDQIREEMENENEKYQDILLITKLKLGMVTQEEVDEINKKKGKKK